MENATIQLASVMLMLLGIASLWRHRKGGSTSKLKSLFAELVFENEVDPQDAASFLTAAVPFIFLYILIYS